MNESYTETVTCNGKTYRYDPDHDCYYAQDHWKDMSPIQAWSPILVLAVLCGVAIYLEFFR
jgi:hypothetical protein